MTTRRALAISLARGNEPPLKLRRSSRIAMTRRVLSARLKSESASVRVPARLMQPIVLP